MVKMSWHGWALSVSTLLDGALVSKVSKSKRKSQTAKEMRNLYFKSRIGEKNLLLKWNLQESHLWIVYWQFEVDVYAEENPGLQM